MGYIEVNDLFSLGERITSIKTLETFKGKYCAKKWIPWMQDVFDLLMFLGKDFVTG